MRKLKQKPREGTVWVAALLLLIGSGIAYRAVAAKLHVITDSPISLLIPLSEFPKYIGPWEGEDIPLSLAIQRVAGNDDFVSRRYKNGVENAWANVYIGYTARPRTMKGHKPQVCYPAAGWILDHTEVIQITSLSGREIPCLLHQFSRPALDQGSVIVLNYYVVNGQITCDEAAFSGIAWRTPNIQGNPARYAAQIQVSSSLESYVRLAAQETIDLVLTHLPDKDGIVKAAEYL